MNSGPVTVHAEGPDFDAWEADDRDDDEPFVTAYDTWVEWVDDHPGYLDESTD